MKDISQETNPVSTINRRRKGVTLIEVILSSVILAILAMLAVNAIFYPRLLVVNSGLEQSAVHAATAELEGHLDDFENPVFRGQFNTDGWIIQNGDITVAPLIPTNETIPGTSGDSCAYLPIHVTINFRDGKTVELVTYRSQEIASDQR